MLKSNLRNLIIM